MSRPALGRLKPEHLSNKLALAQKVMREGILQQSNGSDYWQEAIVVEIDPIGGMMGDPLLGIGNPRFSVRARLVESTGENTNPDSLRDTDELKVCFPALDMYHVQYPIKIGEKVWVFDKTGINGISQRYWVTRSPSPAPVSLDNYARPNNNYANASFEANLFRTAGETGGEDKFLDINQDAKRVDLIDRLASQDPDGFADIAPDESRSRTYFSNVVDRDAGRYGFVSEIIPELFSRPSDYVAQGSNNNALILGTNAVSVEDPSEQPDIADILQIYGYSNDGSDFTNARDQDVNVEEFSPIAAEALPERSFADLVVGRRFNFLSYTLDKSRVAVFENVSVDSLIPGYSDTIGTIKGATAPLAPAALLRSSNIRLVARNSIAVTTGGSCGLYMDTEEGGKLVGNIPLRLELDVNNISINALEDDFSVTVDSVAGGTASFVLNPAGVTLTAPSISLAAPSISFGQGAGIPATVGEDGITFGTGNTGGLINQTTLQTLVPPVRIAVEAVAASLSSPTPVTGPQLAPAMQALVIFFRALESDASYSQTIKV